MNQPHDRSKPGYQLDVSPLEIALEPGLFGLPDQFVRIIKREFPVDDPTDVNGLSVALKRRVRFIEETFRGAIAIMESGTRARVPFRKAVKRYLGRTGHQIEEPFSEAGAVQIFSEINCT